MSSFDEIFKRIQVATNAKIQTELAKVLDIKQSSISDAKRRSSVPAEWYMKLLEKFNLNPLWLKYGIEPVYFSSGIESHTQSEVMGLAEDPTMYGDSAAKSSVCSVYGMACVYSDDVPPPQLSTVGKVALPMNFATTNIVTIRMEAPNMEPYILRNAYIGVDTMASTPISGTVYALHSPHEGLIFRRIFLDADAHRYLLRSEAAGYPEISLDATLLSKRLVGKVAWILQNI